MRRPTARGHRYLTVATDLDTGRVVWAAEGRSRATVEKFFTALGPEQAAGLTHVGCDGADWIHTVVRARAPTAGLCLDSFPVLAWAGEAVEGVRRRITRELRAAGGEDEAASLKGSRWAVLKDPGRLTGGSPWPRSRKTNGPLYRAHLIREQLREAFRVKGPRGRRLLAGVVAWASRSRLPEMVDLARKLRRFKDLITNTLDYGLTSALAPIFHDLDVKPPPSCANVALGLHRKGAGPVGSDDASAQLRGMIHTCRLRS